jgi:hypothetical protein
LQIEARLTGHHSGSGAWVTTKGKAQDREADLTREVGKLRVLLQQAGIDAERGAQKISAMEQQRLPSTTVLVVLARLLLKTAEHRSAGLRTAALA